VSRLEFELRATSGAARLGRLVTPHGIVETPAFMPVGTHGAVKAVTTSELRVCGAQIVLSNTYHLYLRPGHEIVRDLGGLHGFMNWPGPILTDSGGFQIFSLADLRRIDEQGAEFRSHIDGSTHLLSPERSMQIQAALGSDIAMVLDECPAGDADHARVAAAVARTTRWARRSRDAYDGPWAVFGIVQGGVFEDLRERSAREITQLDFPGYAIGGVSVGEPVDRIFRTVRMTTAMLPPDRPRYLMGMGLPLDLLRAVAEGVDIFDCVIPTRHARNGSLFTSAGRINIKRHEYRTDDAPLDAACECETCTGYSRGYLRHLFVSREILAARLHTIHNLTYYHSLMARVRRAIADATFDRLLDETVASTDGAGVSH
jgi:queuine tRNA-ribosyltransferase